MQKQSDQRQKEKENDGGLQRTHPSYIVFHACFRFVFFFDSFFDSFFEKQVKGEDKRYCPEEKEMNQSFRCEHFSQTTTGRIRLNHK